MSSLIIKLNYKHSLVHWTLLTAFFEKRAIVSIGVWRGSIVT